MNISNKNVDLLALAQQNVPLKRAASTNGGEWKGPCPFCGGVDRFWVHPKASRWYCRQCTSKGGDAITYVQKRDGVNYKEACRRLGLPSHYRQRSRPQTKDDTPKSLRHDYVALNDEQWQQGASAFHEMTHEALWGPQGQVAQDYLAGRGLKEKTITDYALGYNPKPLKANWGATKVWLPRGIVIPWCIGKQFWALRVRAFGKEAERQKYYQPRGAASGLFYGSLSGMTPIRPNCQIIMVEGEFDAMLLKQHLNSDWVSVATGSVTGARSQRWVLELSLAARVWLAFDADEAGDKAATWWTYQLKRKTQRLRPENGKDITEMVLAGSDLGQWMVNSKAYFPA